jgi:alkylation response protein AidB-like acyl-CoA dehydrogenase
MDFRFSDEQLSIRDLARGILEKEVTAERLKRVEREPDWFDAPLWATLAEAGLLGLAVPEGQGGMGFGLEEVCIFLHEIGRAVAPVPILPALVLGGLPIREFGSAAQKQEWLPALVAGKAILTAALLDAGASDVKIAPTHARRAAGAWVLDGRKEFVPAAGLASRILVPASTDDGVGVFLVDPEAAGIALTRQETSTGEPVFALALDTVRVPDGDLLGGDPRSGGRIAHWLHERALVALAATQVGVSERALEITSRYVSERHQFGVPIGSFQAVQHRSADGYIDLQAMRWVTWRAVWKLARGLPGAREAAVAKFWVGEGGSRIANSAQHLHGGIGVDVDYPIHRYFLWSKALEIGLGPASAHLARLGADMARTGPS